MTSSDLSSILEDLAAGRIDQAEASRRIAASRTESGATGSPGATGGTPSPSGATTNISDTQQPGSREAAGSGPGRTTPRSGDFSRWQQYARDTFNRVTGQPPGAAGAGQSGTATGSAEQPRGRDSKGVERVSISAVGRRVRVVGDPRVSTALVEGAHVLRRTGSVLEITSDGEIGPSIDGFSLLRTRNLEDVRNLGLGRELLVRVNPDLVVDVELTAGSLTTQGVRCLGKVRVTAGGARLSEVDEAHDVLVQAGQATLKGRITTGRSRIRCESGTLTVELADDSNVTVHAEAQLGKVAWSGGHSGAGDEVVMGNGSARLDVGVVMGHATVRVGGAATAADSQGSGATRGERPQNHDQNKNHEQRQDHDQKPDHDLPKNHDQQNREDR